MLRTETQRLTGIINYLKLQVEFDPPPGGFMVLWPPNKPTSEKLSSNNNIDQKVSLKYLVPH